MKRLVVGLSGASGAALCVHLLEAMRAVPDWETHVVVSGAGERVLREETGLDKQNLAAGRLYQVDDVGACIASGTFAAEGMAVVPCSMKTLAGICHGYAENLLLRAADVTLKERRKLVLVARETPLSLLHLRNMVQLAEMGAVILPPVLTYYHRPHSVRDMSAHIVGKIMNEFRLEAPGFRRWCGACAESDGDTAA